MIRLTMRFTMLVLVALLAGVTGAHAWLDDAFDNTASGQAVFEDMMIHPQSVRGLDGRTYSVYQGADLAPYIVAVTSDGRWEEPVRIAENPLTSAANFDDTHGAPSLLIDADGYLHVFWGSHTSRQRHAISSEPYDINAEWNWNQPVPNMNMTYPQPQIDASGTVTLFYRLDRNAIPWQGHQSGSWMRASLGHNASQFVTATAVLEGDSKVSWYGHTEQGANGRTHLTVVANRRTADTDPFSRYGVYYLYSDADGLWRDVNGTLISESTTRGITYSQLTSSAVECTVYTSPTEQQNQVSVAEDEHGNPGIVFNTGKGFGPDAYRWVFARHDGSGWVTSTIAPTDHLFDSSTIEYNNRGIDAFLTVGGSSGASATLEPYADRGGDIVWFRSTDDGATWSAETTVAAANRDKGVAYNDPQIVLNHDDPRIVGEHGTGPRVFFGEWNNDGSTFVHRIFLWGPDGYLQREFFPQITRVGGPDRYSVSAGLSEKGFPIGSHVAYLVSGTAYADALSAAPLAAFSDAALGEPPAPVLLTSGAALSPATAAELARLKSDTVVIVGGKGSVSTKVESQVRTVLARNKIMNKKQGTIRRISGDDRYEVSANVAAALARKRGPAKAAFVVSGSAWADALSVSAVAAQKGVPVLLVGRDTVPPATARALRALAPSATVVVAGGRGSVSEKVFAAVRADARIGGADRYEVSAGVARLALEGDALMPACSTMRRFCVASGAIFSDALPAAVLAARLRGPLLLTSPHALPAPTREVLDTFAVQVLDATLVGGESTLRQSVADELAELLMDRQLGN